MLRPITPSFVTTSVKTRGDSETAPAAVRCGSCMGTRTARTRSSRTVGRGAFMLRNYLIEPCYAAAMKFIFALLTALLLSAATDPAEAVRTEIMAAYQRSLDALAHGDADGALRIDTSDWISITVGQKPRTRQEMEPFIRRDIASMKPPPGWVASWK